MFTVNIIHPVLAQMMGEFVLFKIMALLKYYFL
jgi:hypothetical protein